MRRILALILTVFLFSFSLAGLNGWAEGGQPGRKGSDPYGTIPKERLTFIFPDKDKDGNAMAYPLTVEGHDVTIAFDADQIDWFTAMTQYYGTETGFIVTPPGSEYTRCNMVTTHDYDYIETFFEGADIGGSWEITQYNDTICTDVAIIIDQNTGACKPKTKAIYGCVRWFKPVTDSDGNEVNTENWSPTYEHKDEYICRHNDFNGLSSFSLGEAYRIPKERVTGTGDQTMTLLSISEGYCLANERVNVNVFEESKIIEFFESNVLKPGAYIDFEGATGPQEVALKGIGYIVKATDEKGNEQSFTTYIQLAPEDSGKP